MCVCLGLQQLPAYIYSSSLKVLEIYCLWLGLHCCNKQYFGISDLIFNVLYIVDKLPDCHDIYR